MQLRFDGTKFGDALEMLRFKAYHQENDTAYLRALDTVNEYWDQEIVDWYNRIARLQFRDRFRGDCVYILVLPKNAAYLVVNRAREGGVFYG